MEQEWELDVDALQMLAGEETQLFLNPRCTETCDRTCALTCAVTS